MTLSILFIANALQLMTRTSSPSSSVATGRWLKITAGKPHRNRDLRRGRLLCITIKTLSSFPTAAKVVDRG